MSLLKSNEKKASTSPVGATAAVASLNQPPTSLKRFLYADENGNSVALADAVAIPQVIKDEFPVNVATKTTIEEKSEAGINPPVPTTYLLTFFLENIKTFRREYLKQIE